MSTLEKELFHIIANHENPETAVLTAIEVFTAFLEQPSEVQGQRAVYPLEFFEKVRA